MAVIASRTLRSSWRLAAARSSRSACSATSRSFSAASSVNGDLAFAPGGQYVVEVSPTAADRTNVTGTATLAGNVLAIFAPGSYITKQYTILSFSLFGGGGEAPEGMPLRITGRAASNSTSS
jgi:hypothetical protein